jgi:3-hydroxy-3-methylglutaryl CoA synthase
LTRRERLKKLAAVQEQLKAFHEMRHATFRAEAIAAESEADALRARFDDKGSMSSLFPEIYHRRIEQALQRAAKNLALAEEEIARVAAATARTNMVERAYRSVKREEERARGDRERLELIARGRPEDLD